MKGFQGIRWEKEMKAKYIVVEESSKKNPPQMLDRRRFLVRKRRGSLTMRKRQGFLTMRILQRFLMMMKRNSSNYSREGLNNNILKDIGMHQLSELERVESYRY